MSIAGDQLPALEKLSQNQQVCLLELRDEEGDLLARPQSPQMRPDDVAQGAEQAIALRPAGDDDGRVRSQNTSELRPGPASCDVEHEVVAPVAPSEVLLRVVDDVVGSERSRLLHVRRAAHRGHLRSERLRDLDGVGPDAARGAVDQHLLPGLEPTLVAKSLQCGDRSDGDRSRLLEGYAGGLRDDRSIGAGAHVFRECPVPSAEHLVARLEVGHVRADRLDLPA